MARPRVSHAKAVKHQSRMRRLLLSGVYLLAVGGLVTWELRDRFEEIDASCPSQSGGEHTSAYAAFYKWLFHRANQETVNQVAVVAFPEELQDIHSNICMGRSYMADVLHAVAAQNPSEIVIDRFYGPDGCKAFPGDTARLLSEVQALHVPVIVGEHADKSETMKKGACLVRVPQLDWGSGFVRRGLVSLNAQIERIPLKWDVLPSDEPDVQPQSADSLAWAAVKAYDPTFAARPGLQDLVKANVHPFVNLNFDLPRYTSTQLLCAAGTPQARQRWAVDCSTPTPPLRLLGKVVVIGSETPADLHYVLNSPMFGVGLQARYIQALLSGRYLRAVPIWVSFSVFGLFVFLIEGLPTLFEVFTPNLRKHPLFTHAFTRRRYIWVIACALTCVVSVSVVALALGYLPPLAAFGDIFLLAITRLLIFTVEVTELPLLHTH